MLTLEEYSSYDALGLAQLLRQREATSEELQDCVRRSIEALNPKLNFLISNADGGIDDVGAEQAPFRGVPFLVKEGAGARGQPAVMGSCLTEGLLAESDSELIRRLRRTGLVIMGSTAAPEFGNSPTTESRLHGPTRNPWNPAHSSGGSSGGASVAVAAGVVPAAQSSDGGGSIRTPAHCCGVFGLKPSRGRTPVGPKSFGGLFGFSVPHVTTRSVRDSAAFLDNIHGDEVGALYRAGMRGDQFLAATIERPRRLRIAYSVKSPSGVPTHPDCVAATAAAADLCAQLGHDVDEAAPIYDWERLRSAMVDVWCAPFPFAINAVEQLVGRRGGAETLEGANLATLAHGAGLSTAQLLQSMATLHTLACDVEQFFLDWDIFISPVDLTPAPKLGVINSPDFAGTALDWFDVTLGKFAAFAPIFNVTGLPAASVPLGMSSGGLPVGVQIGARFGDERSILMLAAQLEQAAPWSARRPALHVASLPKSA